MGKNYPLIRDRRQITGNHGNTCSYWMKSPLSHPIHGCYSPAINIFGLFSAACLPLSTGDFWPKSSIKQLFICFSRNFPCFPFQIRQTMVKSDFGQWMESARLGFAKRFAFLMGGEGKSGICSNKGARISDKFADQLQRSGLFASRR